MNAIVNLIPAKRRLARRRHRRVARWITACAVYGGLLAVLYGVVMARWGDAGDETYGRLDEVRSAYQQSQLTMGLLRARLTEARRQMYADQLITQRPDWSVVLILLAETLDDDLVLQACQLDAPRVSENVTFPGPGSQQGRQLLHLSGMATAPLAVSQLALRLEATGLFSRVAVVETRRGSFASRKVVTFSIECVIEDGTSA